MTGFLLVGIALSGNPALGLSLRDLIDRVIENNLTLKAEKLRIEEERLNQRKADNLFFPNLNGKISTNHQRYIDSSPYALYGSQLETNLATLELVQDYPALGKANHLQKDLSRLNLLIQKVRFQRIERQIQNRSVELFLDYVKETELSKIDKQNLFLIEKLLEIAKLNQEVGIALPNDILRIEVQKANVEASLCGRKFKQDNVLIDLNNLLNGSGAQNLTLDVPQSLKFPVQKPDLASLTSLVLQNDQEVQLAKLDQEIMSTTLKAARSASLPTVSFDGKMNLQNVSTNKAHSGAFRKDYSLNLSLNFPIYDGGDIRAEVSKVEKSDQRTKLVLENLINEKKAALNKAWTDYMEMIEKIKFAEKAVEQSRENMRMVATRYQLGDASIVELVDAQFTLSQSAQSAILDYFDERARLADLWLLAQDLESVKNLDRESIHENLLVDFSALAGR